MCCDDVQHQRQDGAALVHLKEYVSHTKFDLTDHKKITFFLCSCILILSNLSFYTKLLYVQELPSQIQIYVIVQIRCSEFLNH